MPRGVYERTPAQADPMDEIDDGPAGSITSPYNDLDDGLPSREELMERLAAMEARLAAPMLDDEIPEGLIAPTPLSPMIDPSRPEDRPDMKDGEWSRRHLLQFLARQPKDMVFIQKETWEAKAADTYQYVGYMGHGFRVLKNRSVMVPVQIAAIIKQSQEEFPTTQSQAKKRALLDISDMPAEPGSLGVPGLETFLNR